MKVATSYLKHILLPVLPLLVLTSACMKPLSESTSDEKAGLNGGFETVSGHLPVNWLFYTNVTTGQGDFTIGIDTAVKKEGQQSLKFSVKTCSRKGGRYTPGFTREIAVKAGETYRVGIWVKNQNCTYRLSISGVNAHHKSDGLVLNPSTIPSDWVHQECVYTIPEEMDHLRIEFNVLSSGECWVDGVTIEKQ